jgi:hypothetical protein
MKNGKIKEYLKNKIFEVEIDLKNVKNSSNFFKEMNDVFYFPPYFRKNSYDSLNDCMRDLSWIEEDKIIIIFKNLNFLKERNEKLFLDISASLELYRNFWNDSIDSKNNVKIIIE